jgi:hypothetical protein
MNTDIYDDNIKEILLDDQKEEIEVIRKLAKELRKR